MSQNINLFNPAFRKQPQRLTLGLVAICMAITLSALLGVNYYLQQQVDGLAAELAATEKLLRAQSEFVAKLKEKGNPVETEAQIDAEISQLETEMRLAGESIEALKGGAFGSQRGFAEYLRAFSRQAIGGLWLTEFSIGGSGALELRGRVLSADLLPSYIQRLNRERVLAGSQVARLEIVRHVQEPTADKDKDKGKAARAPRYLEFSLATEATGPEKKP